MEKSHKSNREKDFYCNFYHKKIRHKINQNTALLLYDVLILPHISYCNAVWANTCKTYTINISRMQKRALRACLCNYKAHTSRSLFTISRKLTLDNINKTQVA